MITLDEKLRFISRALSAGHEIVRHEGFKLTAQTINEALSMVDELRNILEECTKDTLGYNNSAELETLALKQREKING